MKKGGGEKTLTGSPKTREECYNTVKSEYPDAKGANWHMVTNGFEPCSNCKCYAHLDDSVAQYGWDFHETCLFEGMYAT